jgi:ribose/xylose/arabinose/galactoside ABC-type transport system permease subunit
MRRAGGLPWLLACVVLCAACIDNSVVVLVAVPLLVSLLAAEIDRRGGQLAAAIVVMAAWLLPSSDREEFREEWIDHVRAAGEYGVLPLTRALSIALIACPCLAVGLRVGRNQRRSSR